MTRFGMTHAMNRFQRIMGLVNRVRVGAAVPSLVGIEAWGSREVFQVDRHSSQGQQVIDTLTKSVSEIIAKLKHDQAKQLAAMEKDGEVDQDRYKKVGWAQNLSYMKEVEKILEKVDEECCICLENMHRPTLTPCMHLFCHECIQGVVNAATYTLPTCPICRTTFTRTSKFTELTQDVAGAKASKAKGSQAVDESKDIAIVGKGGAEIMVPGPMAAAWKRCKANSLHSSKLNHLIASMQGVLSQDPGAKVIIFT